MLIFTEYTLKQLQGMPTISQAQTSDLKVDHGHIRQWLSRCTTADGEPYDHKVTIEHLNRGRWEVVHTYQAH